MLTSPTRWSRCVAVFAALSILTACGAPPRAEPAALAAPTVSEAGAQRLPQAPAAPEEAAAARGRALFRGHVASEGFIPCATCHAVDPAAPPGVGPNLAGVALAAAERVPGLAPAEYLRRSILVHDDQIAPGYGPGIVRGVVGRDFGELLSAAQVDELVAYLQTLAAPEAALRGAAQAGPPGAAAAPVGSPSGAAGGQQGPAGPAAPRASATPGQRGSPTDAQGGAPTSAASAATAALPPGASAIPTPTGTAARATATAEATASPAGAATATPAPPPTETAAPSPAVTSPTATGAPPTVTAAPPPPEAPTAAEAPSPTSAASPQPAPTPTAAPAPSSPPASTAPSPVPSVPDDPSLAIYQGCVSCHSQHPAQVQMPHPLNPTCNDCHRGSPNRIGCPSCHSTHMVDNRHDPLPDLPCASCHT